MAAPLGLHPRMVLALLRDRLDPLLYRPACEDDEHPGAFFPCDPPLSIPWNTVQAMLRRGLISEHEHEGVEGRISYVSHPAALAEAFPPEDVLRHRATLRCWERSYYVMVARGQPTMIEKRAAR